MIYIIIALTALCAMSGLVIARQNKMLDRLSDELYKQMQPLEPIEVAEWHEAE